MSADLENELRRRLQTLLEMPHQTQQQLTDWYERARTLEQWLLGKEICSDVPHEIWHYLADADIRAKESAYAQMQTKFVSEYIQNLNVPYEDIESEPRAA